jgi:hypothetical protein
MADTAKVEHKVMGLNDNKTGEQSNGLKVEVAIFILLIIGAIVIIGFCLGIGWPDEPPDNFSNLLTVEAVKDYLDYRERLRSARLQFLTTIAAILGGIGVVFNLYYTGKREEAFNKSAIAANKSADAALKNAEAAQDKQITERFTKAVEQLASPEIAVRLGGIYALERIAKDSEKDHWTIIEVLTAFVREKRPWKEEKEPSTEITTDIQAVLTVIGRRSCEKEEENQKPDLKSTDFRRTNLREAKLQKVSFLGANLQKVIFNNARLQKAEFLGAELQEADLCNANLQEAWFLGANLQEANLCDADLQGAFLHEADLTGAKNLKQEQIDKAFGDKNTTRLPEYLKAPAHWSE